MTFNPLEHPASLAMPLRLVHSEWLEHVPFGMAAVSMTRPKLIVELGVYTGISYAGFCQAVQALKLDARCCGIDTWAGDPHSGVYPAQVYEDLRPFHDGQFGAFSRLIRSTFDEAREHFADGAIDLLHIDGMHDYESVRHDFETWRPKLSPRGVVLFHDIHVRQGTFGVWRLWDELKTRFPSFEFVHQHGLGVLAVGTEIPAGLRPLLELDEAGRHHARNFYAQLGRRLTFRRERDEAVAALPAFRQEQRRLEGVIQRQADDAAATQEAVRQLHERLAEAHAALAAQSAVAAQTSITAQAALAIETALGQQWAAVRAELQATRALQQEHYSNARHWSKPYALRGLKRIAKAVLPRRAA